MDGLAARYYLRLFLHRAVPLKIGVRNTSRLDKVLAVVGEMIILDALKLLPFPF